MHASVGGGLHSAGLCAHWRNIVAASCTATRTVLMLAPYLRDSKPVLLRRLFVT
jgi:hypothetical protein